jgi:hypothetical protein
VLLIEQGSLDREGLGRIPPVKNPVKNPSKTPSKTPSISSSNCLGSPFELKKEINNNH